MIIISICNKGILLMNRLTGNRLATALVATFVSALVVIYAPSAVAANHEEISKLNQTIQQLKRQLEALEQRLEELSESVDQNAQAVETTAETVEEYSSQPSAFDRLSIGGYGELHYNNLNAKDSSNDKEQIDFHRFVLFFGYQFTDQLKSVSEFELEHALVGDGEPGEVELEQAYVEYTFNDRNAARVGLFLLPVGILNETHEPPTFYGVERNNIENVIIPASWWAGGAGYTHRADNGFSLDLAVHEGLKIGDVANARIRSGRQKTAEADADDLAATARLKYTGSPGLELAATVQYQSDVTQESSDGLDDAYLWEVHVAFNRGKFGLRALYADWNLGTDEGAVGQAIEDAGSDDQQGWYIEPSFRFTDTFGVFARYEDVEGGRLQDRFDQWAAGFNYWLHDSVVLKADYVDRNHDEDSEEARDFDGFNLGFGYSF